MEERLVPASPLRPAIHERRAFAGTPLRPQGWGTRPTRTMDTFKAHGMAGTLVEPDWPPLTNDEVRSLLVQFPECRGPYRIASASPRPFSAASVVCTELGRVFVKRHHRDVRDREGPGEEHLFMEHLRQRGVPVPRVLATDLGETVVVTGEWTYEVHDLPQGVDLYEDAMSWTPFRSVEHALAAGQMLARLHLAARDFPAPPRKVRPLVASFSIFASSEPEEAMKRYLDARPVLKQLEVIRRCCDDALELLGPFHRKLLPLLPALPPLWTHNDLHPSNLFWSDNTENARATAVIDFGLADRTNAVHDIAHAIERSIVEWLVLVGDAGHPDEVPVRFDQLNALLDGYQSVRPLSPEEAAALAPMTALCHAEFALTEAAYFLGVLHSEEKARLAYDGYLVGHAQWFRSATGAKTLAALSSRAEERNRPRPGVARP